MQNGEGFAFELLSVGTAVVGMNQALWKPSDEPTGRTAYMVMYTGSKNEGRESVNLPSARNGSL